MDLNSASVLQARYDCMCADDMLCDETIGQDQGRGGCRHDEKFAIGSEVEHRALSNSNAYRCTTVEEYEIEGVPVSG
jgi:hypothetical protein